MKIASFNTNGIRARLALIKQWMEKRSQMYYAFRRQRYRIRIFPGRPLKI